MKKVCPAVEEDVQLAAQLDVGRGHEHLPLAVHRDVAGGGHDAHAAALHRRRSELPEPMAGREQELLHVQAAFASLCKIITANCL